MSGRVEDCPLHRALNLRLLGEISASIRAMSAVLSPPPLAGEGQGGAHSTAPARGKSPLPNPPPQAGEGKKAARLFVLATLSRRRWRKVAWRIVASLHLPLEGPPQAGEVGFGSARNAR